MKSAHLPINPHTIVLEQSVIKNFQTTIGNYFNQQGRIFDWRQTTNPYHIVTSEIMLQQTQTYRVAEKYPAFIARFPDFIQLAQAPLRDVLFCWQGLGYNRRALALQASAQKVVTEYKGILPDDPEILITFPGIGKATAASICAFAFNKPTIFIETNIRSVFIHFFFQHKECVTDQELYPLVAQTLDRSNPRQWYYALMDYGVMLKKTQKNPSRKSAHHNQQSTFEGSDRQIRGRILKELTIHPALSYDQLIEIIQREPHRIEKMLFDLAKEGFIKNRHNLFMLN